MIFSIAFLLVCFIFTFRNFYCSRLRAAKVFPERVVAAYASWSECDFKVSDAVRDGANIIIWFAINLDSDISGLPIITGGPNYTCVANTINQLKNDGYGNVVHLISTGGWDAMHPKTDNSAEEVFDTWKYWNEITIVDPNLGFYGFDGLDWDIEGNDVATSPYNAFTIECLDLMGKMSQILKANDYFVTMAPAESYLDALTSDFNRLLNNTYSEWHQDFTYHGKNSYAYILAKYGNTQLLSKGTVPTFDMISIQLYEGWSHCSYNMSQTEQLFKDYLYNIVKIYSVDGWIVNFEMDPSTNLPSQRIFIPPSQLVIGLGNGWTILSNDKFLYLPISEISDAYYFLQSLNIQIKGFMYWDIADDGMSIEGQPLYMSKALNSFMSVDRESFGMNVTNASLSRFIIWFAVIPGALFLIVSSVLLYMRYSFAEHPKPVQHIAFSVLINLLRSINLSLIATIFISYILDDSNMLWLRSVIITCSISRSINLCYWIFFLFSFIFMKKPVTFLFQDISFNCTVIHQLSIFMGILDISIIEELMRLDINKLDDKSALHLHYSLSSISMISNSLTLLGMILQYALASNVSIQPPVSYFNFPSYALTVLFVSTLFVLMYDVTPLFMDLLKQYGSKRVDVKDNNFLTESLLKIKNENQI